MMLGKLTTVGHDELRKELLGTALSSTNSTAVEKFIETHEAIRGKMSNA